MTARSDYYTNTANEFLTKARVHLAEDDLLQASEKGWGAAAQMVKAVADTRGWPHSSHRDLYRAVDRLADETSVPQLKTLFRSAGTLHQNFYEGWMAVEDVADGLSDVEEIVGRLQAAGD
ncbi:MAG: PaREP1 family protein [Chloroflexi bacterium]|nr:PaREP1 family protein [Chloroflexota bacterium]